MKKEIYVVIYTLTDDDSIRNDVLVFDNYKEAKKAYTFYSNKLIFCFNLGNLCGATKLIQECNEAELKTEYFDTNHNVKNQVIFFEKNVEAVFNDKNN